jgi:hypothetical protein
LRGKISLIMLFWAVFVPAAYAQTQYFTDESFTRLPDTTVLSIFSCVADIDGDGDLDICVATCDGWTPSGPEYLLINNGAGVFTCETEGRLPPSLTDARDVSFGDIDGDGDADLAIGAGNGTDRLLVNDGFGYFSDETDIRMPAFAGTANEMVFGDLTGDFAIDLFRQEVERGGSRLLINDGAGFFSDSTAGLLPPDTTENIFVEPVDVDNDLDLDIIKTLYSNHDNPDRWASLFINTGEGYFNQADTIRFPFTVSVNITSGDIDLDGDADVILSSGGTGVDVLINDGSGYFTNETSMRMPVPGEPVGATGMALCDFDNDGDLDIFVTRGSYYEPIKLYINNGDGIFTDESWRLPDITPDAWSACAFDADGDGDADLFLSCGGFGYQKLLINYSSPDTIPPVISAYTILGDMPDTLSSYPVKALVWDGVSRAMGELRCLVYYRANNGPLDSLLMTDLGGTLWGARIPQQEAGANISYYYSAIDRMGNIITKPQNAPDSAYHFSVYGTNSANAEIINRDFSLGAYPNPFNSSISIEINNSKGGDIEIVIYDIRGNLVKYATKGGFDSETSYQYKWDATNTAGEKVCSGVYFAQVRTPHATANIRLIFLK